MPSLTAIRGMLRADARRLARDRFLVGVGIYLLGVTVAMRWVVPWLSSELARRLAFDFAPYVPLLVSHFVIQISGQLGGIVAGLLLLESREDGTMKAMLVTPVPLPIYLAALGGVTMVTTAVLAMGEGLVIGWGLPSWPGLVAAAIVGAPGAAILGLAVAGLADDKTEAFAYLKILGIFPAASSGAWFAPEPWQWLFAVYPPHCASKVYWLAEAGDGRWPLFAAVGVVGSCFWVAVLGRRFLVAARR